jgi:LacI family transcriptional regulator
LSSIDPAPETIGYEEAALLDRMMSGRRAPAPDIQVPPRGIVTRLSTDVLATEDQAVAGAVGYIRSHACDDICVGDVLGHVNLSRSALEPRLKRVIGRTIHQEIHRVRLERVKVLLATTDLPTKQISAQAGFHSVQYLARVFRSATSQTPASYRKKMRR